MRKEKLKELKTYIEELKTIERELVRDEVSGFLRVERYSCRLANGKEIKRDKLIKGNSEGSACVILPVTKEGDVILVVQSRVFTEGSVGVELPAGYVESGEDAIEAARRELFEETGYVADKMIPLKRYYQDQGVTGEFNYNFLALDCEKKGEQHLDKDEFIKCFLCTYDEVLELVDLGYIGDVNSLYTLEKSRGLMKRKRR